MSSTDITCTYPRAQASPIMTNTVPRVAATSMAMARPGRCAHYKNIFSAPLPPSSLRSHRSLWDPSPSHLHCGHPTYLYYFFASKAFPTYTSDRGSRYTPVITSSTFSPAALSARPSPSSYLSLRKPTCAEAIRGAGSSMLPPSHSKRTHLLTISHLILSACSRQ